MFGLGKAEHNGQMLPVPFINETGQFVQFDSDRMQACAEELRCQVCGQQRPLEWGIGPILEAGNVDRDLHLPSELAYLIDGDPALLEAEDHEVITMNGAALCHGCVNVTLRLCPHLARQHPDEPYIHRLDRGFFTEAEELVPYGPASLVDITEWVTLSLTPRQWQTLNKEDSA